MQGPSLQRGCRGPSAGSDEAMDLDDAQRAAITTLLDDAEDRGCLNLADVATLIARTGLD